LSYEFFSWSMKMYINDNFCCSAKYFFHDALFVVYELLYMYIPVWQMPASVLAFGSSCLAWRFLLFCLRITPSLGSRFLILQTNTPHKQNTYNSVHCLRRPCWAKSFFGTSFLSSIQWRTSRAPWPDLRDWMMRVREIALYNIHIVYICMFISLTLKFVDNLGIRTPSPHSTQNLWGGTRN
jgi:hypothetical protein